MRLFYGPTSPYARKVRIVIAEKGLDAQVEKHLCNPFEDTAKLRALNPLCKIPALALDDASVLYDSRVIAGYLDSLDPATRLIPDQGAGRWTVLRQEALGDGILDAAFALVMESRRPEAQQSASWKERWTTAIGLSLEALESEVGSLTPEPSLAHIAFGCALGYLEFRLPHLGWRDRHAKTWVWFDAFSRRASMVATQPEE